MLIFICFNFLTKVSDFYLSTKTQKTRLLPNPKKIPVVSPMHYSLLVRTLKLLTQEEIELLHLFVATPLFNDVRAKETRELFEYIKKYYPDFCNAELTREAAAAFFFVNHRNPDSELQRTMAQLLGIIRQFVAFLHFSSTGSKTNAQSGKQKSADSTAFMLNKIRQQLAMLRFYNERSHPSKLANEQESNDTSDTDGRKKRRPENLFQNLFNDIKTNLHDEDNYGSVSGNHFNDLFYLRFLLEQEKSFHENMYESRVKDNNFLQTIEELDQFYLITKIDLMCKLVHQQRMGQLYEDDEDAYNRLRINREISLSLVRSFQQNNYLFNPFVNLYCNLLTFMMEDDPDKAEASYNHLLVLFNKLEHQLPTSRSTEIKVLIRGYWPMRYRETKNKRFLERLHHLQLDQIEKMSEAEPLASSHFQSTIFTALRLNKTEWAHHFFLKYQHKLIGGPKRNQVATICKATILLSQEKAHESADVLGHYFGYSDIEDIYLYCMAATLDVRIRYDLNDLDSEESERLIHTASTRIRRDNLLPENRKKERLRFFTLAKSLYRTKVRRDLDKRTNISKDLAAWKNKLDEGPVVDWEWLEEKYAELSD